MQISDQDTHQPALIACGLSMAQRLIQSRDGFVNVKAGLGLEGTVSVMWHLFFFSSPEK